jgi:hypothetical protein
LASGYADLWERHEAFDALDVQPYNAAIISLREASARFAQEPAEQVKEFADRLIVKIGQIPDRLARGKRIKIIMTLELKLSPDIIAAHQQALQQVADAHWKGLPA